jgi:hypothetical protein
MLNANHAFTTIRSVTKTVRIACDPRTAFDFLADLGNWPLWAVVNVKSTSRTEDPEWTRVICNGDGAEFNQGRTTPNAPR